MGTGGTRRASPFQADLEGIRLVSTDVFDTLVHRGTLAERHRFWHIARLAAVRLAAEGHPVSARLLLASRLMVQRAAYRGLELERPEGDVTLQGIVQCQARLLGLPQALSAVLAEAELEIEAKTLSANPEMTRWLTEVVAPRGIRVIAISDTYLDGASLRHLLARVVPAVGLAQVYTSADLGLTKRSGQLFPAVMALEKQAPEHVLHLGDDPVADGSMARRASLRTVGLAVPLQHRFPRKLDAAISRLRFPVGWPAHG